MPGKPRDDTCGLIWQELGLASQSMPRLDGIKGSIFGREEPGGALEDGLFATLGIEVCELGNHVDDLTQFLVVNQPRLVRRLVIVLVELRHEINIRNV